MDQLVDADALVGLQPPPNECEAPFRKAHALLRSTGPCAQIRHAPAPLTSVHAWLVPIDLPSPAARETGPGSASAGPGYEE